MSDLATERLQTNPVRQGYVSEIEVCEKFDSFVSILNGLGKSLLSSRVKNAVIPLLQTKTADTTHTGIFARVTRTFSLSTVVSIECGHSEHIHGGARLLLIFHDKDFCCFHWRTVTFFCFVAFGTSETRTRWII